MGELVSYAVADSVATVTMDDGKVNVLGFEMFAALSEALDRAEADRAGVLLVGRDGRFSGGFDLKVLMTFGPEMRRLLRTGFELSHRMLSFPLPIVVACTGHAYAMGAFLMASTDYRIGVAGADHVITANEVAIGLPLPRAALEICRQRLTRTHFDRAMILAEVFHPDTAVEAGFLDEVVPEGTLHDAARQKAIDLMALDLAAHAATKRRAREATLATIRAAIEADDADLAAAM